MADGRRLRRIFRRNGPRRCATPGRTFVATRTTKDIVVVRAAEAPSSYFHPAGPEKFH